MRARKSGERAFRTLRYVSTEKLQQTRQLKIFTMVTLLQRPPLAMFDPSLIHRNDEIFNPEPYRLGIFFVVCARGEDELGGYELSLSIGRRWAN